MKGRQVAMTVYLPPNKYWLLKSLSRRSGQSMQSVMRRGLDSVLAELQRSVRPR